MPARPAFILALIGRLLPALLLVAVTMAAAGQPAREPHQDRALLVDVRGAIGPATAKLLSDALAAAEERAARFVILRIDTPRGPSARMLTMIRDNLSAPPPVATNVAPSCARAPRPDTT